jgi:thiamine-phosphate pyrophosphorylase
VTSGTTRPDLRLIVITDAAQAAPRRLLDIVAACLAAGAPAIQLRDKRATARELLAQALELRSMTHAHGALLFINDRIDVAVAAQADGAHLGPDDVPLAAIRRHTPPGFLLGYSTDDPLAARRAARDGADYLGCGAVFGTTSKAEAAGERIGIERLAAVAGAVAIPVVGIGGVSTANVTEVAAAGAAGAAVIGAVMQARDPAAAVRALLAPWEARQPPETPA